MTSAARDTGNRDERAVLHGTIPSGDEFSTAMTRDSVTLRVGDRICAAHPRWMTRQQAG